MGSHVEKLLKEPLVWLGALVLCVPLFGSGKLMQLRDALIFDSTSSEYIELASSKRTIKPTTEPRPTSDFRAESNFEAESSFEAESEFETESFAETGSLPDDVDSVRQSPLPPFDEEKMEDEPEDRMAVSLPGSSLPELALNNPEPATRDPGSLLDFESEYESTNDMALQEIEPEAGQSGQQAPKQEQEPEFDFLFGEDGNTEPEPDNSFRGNQESEITSAKPDSIAGEIPQTTMQPGEAIQNGLYSESGGQSAEPEFMDQPGFAAPLGSAQPHQPQAFGQSTIQQTPGQHLSADIYQQDTVAIPAPIHSGQIMPATAPAYSASMANNHSTPVYAASTYSTPTYASQSYATPIGPVYHSNIVPLGAAEKTRGPSNYAVGLTGLFFQRDYEDNLRLAYNPAGEELYTNDANERTFDGFGVSLASRNSLGRGFEASWWALNPGTASASLDGNHVVTTITGLDQLLDVASGQNLYDIFSYSATQSVIRDTDINSLEFNLLRNRGTFHTRGNRQGSSELFGGFRWFEFSESLQYAAFADTASFPTTPSEVYYNLQARNRLLGLQIGARNELSLGSKLRFFAGVRGGVFNNNIRTVQNITNVHGEIAQVNGGPATGRPFSYNDEKNDVAYLGELNFGVLWHLTCRTRIRFGYRVLGASGVALAAHQLPFRYDDPEELLRANSNGSLLLNGGFYGLEFSF